MEFVSFVHNMCQISNIDNHYANAVCLSDIDISQGIVTTCYILFGWIFTGNFPSSLSVNFFLNWSQMTRCTLLDSEFQSIGIVFFLLFIIIYFNILFLCSRIGLSFCVHVNVPL